MANVFKIVVRTEFHVEHDSELEAIYAAMTASKKANKEEFSKMVISSMAMESCEVMSDMLMPIATKSPAET